jgi:hypothetical protein
MTCADTSVRREPFVIFVLMFGVGVGVNKQLGSPVLPVLRDLQAGLGTLLPIHQDCFIQLTESHVSLR